MRNFFYLLVIACIVAPSVNASVNTTAKLVDTGWCGRAGDNYTFQAFQLDRTEAEYNFYSYLHNRPEHIGTWNIDGDNLVLEANDLVWHFNIVRVEDQRLVMLNLDSDKLETYYTSKCDHENDEYSP